MCIRDRLQKNRLIDFDDMLVYTYELFSQRKDILALWQKKFRYILIDEFQDINGLQYEIIRMLAAPENNLFVVGDDDQSIYRFRQARPEIMLNFEKDYADAKRIVLNYNYRSDGNIVAAAGRLIAHNTGPVSYTHLGEGALRCRFLDMGLIPKTKVQVRKVAPMGDPIELRIRGYELTIRKEDAGKIEVEPEEN